MPALGSSPGSETHSKCTILGKMLISLTYQPGSGNSDSLLELLKGLKDISLI